MDQTHKHFERKIDTERTIKTCKWKIQDFWPSIDRRRNERFPAKSLNSAVCWEMYGIFQFLRTKSRVICRRRTAVMIPSVRCSVRVKRTEWNHRNSPDGYKPDPRPATLWRSPLLNGSHRWKSLKADIFNQSRACARPNRITNEIEKEKVLINSPF